MRKIYILLGCFVVLLLPAHAQGFYFANETVIRPTASNTIYHVADYYNATSLTFDGQPARMIVLDGRYLHLEAGEVLNSTITNHSSSYRSMFLVNTSLNPATELNASGLNSGWTADIKADGVLIASETINASGWLNYIFQNYAGPETLLEFNQTPPSDVTPPTFDNVINHTHTVNTSFTYDVDATDISGIDAFMINGTNFSINRVTGVITNVTTLNYTRTEWINISVNDTVGNLAWEIFYINITEPGVQSMLGLLEGKFYQEKWLLYTYIELPIDQDIIMPDNSLYYSTDQRKLVYKDPDGVVRDLY